MGKFRVVSDFAPMGDQPQAIREIADGILAGREAQTLMGVTGSGKTFTMAKIIEAVQKPTLVISHNKTLAAQLHGEFKEFFPDNAVEYFVSYYDYYQPEAYVPSRDLYIEKDADINEEIGRDRQAETLGYGSPAREKGCYHSRFGFMHLRTRKSGLIQESAHQPQAGYGI